MLAVEELLQPISSASEAGRNLCYDPVFDRIREALAEDDETLPMGSWVRQVKRADYPLATLLAHDALKTLSKDLWLAGWLGEATIQVEGSEALEPALRLIAGLQKRFWPSLYPQIEDNDCSMRAAPVQWSLDRFAMLVEKFPITRGGLPFSAYKAIRAGMVWSENENSITAESLNEALQSTPIDFFARSDLNVTQALKTLGEVQTFCDEHYKGDGPSFSVLRDVLEELRGLVAQQLRLRPVEREEPLPPAEEKSNSEKASADVETNPQTAELASTFSDTVREESVASLRPAQPAFGGTDHLASAKPQSWEEAMDRVVSSAVYLFDQRPEDPACYLLAMALQQNENAADTPSYPLPDARLALKRAFEGESWSILLVQALQAISNSGTKRWLDPHFYAWQAARNLGAIRLQDTVSTLVRTYLTQSCTWSEETFSDDTPVANAETKRWLKDELAPRMRAPVVSREPAFPLLLAEEDPTSVFAASDALLERGEITQALELLMNAATKTQTGRDNFVLRMAICDVSLKAGKKALAANLLQHMLSETEHLRLEQWEGRSLLGRLLSMTLESIDQNAANVEQRRNIYARLCAINPALAFTALEAA